MAMTPMIMPGEDMSVLKRSARKPTAIKLQYIREIHQPPYFKSSISIMGLVIVMLSVCGTDIRRDEHNSEQLRSHGQKVTALPLLSWVEHKWGHRL